MRERPSDRQACVQYKIRHATSNSRALGDDSPRDPDKPIARGEYDVLCTASFDSEPDGTMRSPARVVAVFCADFKAGTDFHGLVTDFSIVMSKLLQSGTTLEELVPTLIASPPSLIFDVLRGALETERDVRRDRGELS